MSSLSRWSYTETLTVWPPASFDAYGQPTFGTPYTLAGTWEHGGDTVTDDSGNEFVAASKYYFELEDGSASMPTREGYIKRGDHTGTADPVAAGAERIKKVGGWSMTMFGSSEIPDWVLFT